MLNNVELKNTAALNLSFEDYKTRFHIVSAKRSDSGNYIIKASNKNGRDEADKNILVVGPPDRPQGPLLVEDVFADRYNYLLDFYQHFSYTFPSV